MVKGFKTKEAAKKYQRKYGGSLSYKDQKGRRALGYIRSVLYDGLDDKKYPYCLRWDK